MIPNNNSICELMYNYTFSIVSKPSEVRNLSKFVFIFISMTLFEKK